jgi:hypothetical protein
VAHLKVSAQWVLEVDAVGCVLHHIFDICVYIYIYTHTHVCQRLFKVSVCVCVSEAVSDTVCYRGRVVTVVC